MTKKLINSKYLRALIVSMSIILLISLAAEALAATSTGAFEHGAAQYLTEGTKIAGLDCLICIPICMFDPSSVACITCLAICWGTPI